MNGFDDGFDDELRGVLRDDLWALASPADPHAWVRRRVRRRRAMQSGLAAVVTATVVAAVVVQSSTATPVSENRLAGPPAAFGPDQAEEPCGPDGLPHSVPTGHCPSGEAGLLFRSTTMPFADNPARRALPAYLDQFGRLVLERPARADGCPESVTGVRKQGDLVVADFGTRPGEECEPEGPRDYRTVLSVEGGTFALPLSLQTLTGDEVDGPPRALAVDARPTPTCGEIRLRTVADTLPGSAVTCLTSAFADRRYASLRVVRDFLTGEESRPGLREGQPVITDYEVQEGPDVQIRDGRSGTGLVACRTLTPTGTDLLGSGCDA